ncbi:MAG: laminin G domain-containing protein [Planctomycetaceae bacterium]|nr:laminin G domain-containing protein [Planctomycetaceae bacterium]
MGQEITYCSVCGCRLSGTDFERGKAFRSELRTLCRACFDALPPDARQAFESRKEPEPRKAPPGPGTSTRIPTARAVAPARSNRALLLVGGAFLLLALVLAIAVLAGRGSPPPDYSPPSPPVAVPPRAAEPAPAPREDPALAEARRSIDAARAREKSSPNDLDAQIAAWEEAVRKAGLSPLLKEAMAGLREAQARRPAPPRPEVPVPAPAPAPGPVPPPSPPPAPAASAEMLAYAGAWEAAARKASARDFKAAVSDLMEVAGRASDPDVKREARRDADDLEAARAALADARSAFAALPRRRPISIESYAAGSTERTRARGSLLRATPLGMELRLDDQTTGWVDLESITASTLADAIGTTPPELARALAIACLLEGDAGTARRVVHDPESIVARVWDYGPRAKPSLPEAPAKEREARDLFARACREFSKPDSLAAATAGYKRLLQDFAQTALVKTEAALIKKRADAGRDYLFVAPALTPHGAFSMDRPARGEAAWTCKADGDPARPIESWVDADFVALPETAYRAWALVAGCCAETLTFHVQVNEVDAVVKPSSSGLKKSHALHVPKIPKSPQRTEWVSVPVPKPASGGLKKIRLLSNQQGFSVLALAVSATRSSPPSDQDLKDESLRFRAEQGLVGWWKLDETGGTTAADSIPSGHAGAVEGAVKWTPGRLGNALHFDGSGRVLVNGVLALHEVTLSAWVWHDNVDEPIQRYVSLAGEAAVIRFQADKGLHFYVRTDGELRQLHVPNAVEAQKWIHVTGTWDGTTMRLYKDGVALSSMVPGGRLYSPTPALLIGASDAETLRGSIDDVRIYDRALTPEEVERLYGEGTPWVPGSAPPPEPAGKPWRPLFDKTTTSLLRPETTVSWTVDKGALVKATMDQAGQTREEFGDGEIRVRFELSGPDKFWVAVRQGPDGSYGWDGSTAGLAQGKTYDLLFTMKGDSVTAAVDGKPQKLTMNRSPRKGCIQFNANGRGVRILSVEFRDAP